VLRTALTLAKRGLHVFPCRPRAKEPSTLHGVKDATTNPEIIRAWWSEIPQANVAVATGSVSGIFVLDVDGMDAEAGLHRLEASHGALPPTVESITARGRHLFFRASGAPVRNSVGKVAPSIDVRANGGYVLVPPSIHPSGRAYAWSVDSANAFADAPQWLLDKVTDRTNGKGKIEATPAAEWREIVEGSLPDGRRDCTVTRLTGYLLRRYVDPCMVLELMRSFNITHGVPPLPDEDVRRIVNSISGKELERRGLR
jgi:Bifunctional DNA primase/polymerase, N-terminal/Primase C terminal 1 (PriCT-1)